MTARGIVAWLDDGTALVAAVPVTGHEVVPHSSLRVAFELLDRRYTAARYGGRRPADLDGIERCLRALDGMAGFLTWANDYGTPAGEGLRRWKHAHGDDHPLPADRMPGCRFLDALRTTAAQGGVWPRPMDYDERNDR